MRIMEPESRPQALIRQLLTVWEGAVKQTHLFLSAEEIEKIKQYVPQALRVVPHLVVLENRDGVPVAFMGIEERNLEMLFVAPEQRGQGWGKSLIEYGVERYGIETVGVNEHLGFVVYERKNHDEQGNPYPILYMRRSSTAESGWETGIAQE